MNVFIEKLYQSLLINSELEAIQIDDKKLTYKEFLQKVSNIRNEIKELPDLNFGIYLSHDFEMYASILALWFEGKTYVPIHPDFPLNKNIEVINQADINYILSSVEVKIDFSSQIIISSNLKNVEIQPPVDFQLDKNAYILFTSGSTGKPKGVPITFENLHYFSMSFFNTFGEITKDDKVLQMFELTFDLSVMSYLIPWISGAKMIGLHREEPKNYQILDLLEEDKITVALMVPSMMNSLIPFLDNEIINSSLRLNLFCGEALLKSFIDKWKKFVPRAAVYNVYGPTENTIFCTYYKVDESCKEINDIVSIGKAMQYNQLSFYEKKVVEGELLLSGKQLTKGYWKNSEITQKTFFEKDQITYYKTGDFCKKDEEGDYFFINRIDFQTKINGFRIELSEIEYFANQYAENLSSIALINSREGIDELVLVVNNQEIDSKIRRYLKQFLPDYSIPTRIVYLETFPTNMSGKTDRKAISKWVNTL